MGNNYGNQGKEDLVDTISFQDAGGQDFRIETNSLESCPHCGFKTPDYSKNVLNEVSIDCDGAKLVWRSCGCIVLQDIDMPDELLKKGNTNMMHCDVCNEDINCSGYSPEDRLLMAIYGKCIECQDK